jgi:hypothetical protein
MDHASALAATDPDICRFAATLDSRFQVIDLRQPQPGMGFSWGRYGPKTKVRRDGQNRLFAYAKPVKTGFFSKLFGQTSDG